MLTEHECRLVEKLIDNVIAEDYISTILENGLKNIEKTDSYSRKLIDIYLHKLNKEYDKWKIDMELFGMLIGYLIEKIM